MKIKKSQKERKSRKKNAAEGIEQVPEAENKTVPREEAAEVKAAKAETVAENAAVNADREAAGEIEGDKATDGDQHESEDQSEREGENKENTAGDKAEESEAKAVDGNDAEAENDGSAAGEEVPRDHTENVPAAEPDVKKGLDESERAPIGFDESEKAPQIAQLPTAPTVERRDILIENIRQRRIYRVTLYLTVFLMIAIVAASIVLAVFYMPVIRVTGNEMSPEYRSGDILLLWKSEEYERGDLAVISFDNKLLIKRIIAREGDEVDIDDEGNVFLNGAQLDEPYLLKKGAGNMNAEFPMKIPSGKIFVLGDNRVKSIDSRYTEVGILDENTVLGKVLLRVFPFDKRS